MYCDPSRLRILICSANVNCQLFHILRWVKNHPVLYIFKMGLKTGRSEMCLKIQKDFVRKQFAERMRRWQQRKESPTKKLKSNYPEGCSKNTFFNNYPGGCQIITINFYTNTNTGADFIGTKYTYGSVSRGRGK